MGRIGDIDVYNFVAIIAKIDHDSPELTACTNHERVDV